MKRERRGAGPPLALRFTLRVLYSQFSIEALELRNIAAARVDLHLDTPSGDVAALDLPFAVVELELAKDRKSTRLNSSHVRISYAVFCLKKKKKTYSLSCLQKKKKKTK